MVCQRCRCTPFCHRAPALALAAAFVSNFRHQSSKVRRAAGPAVQFRLHGVSLAQLTPVSSSQYLGDPVPLVLGPRFCPSAPVPRSPPPQSASSHRRPPLLPRRRIRAPDVNPPVEFEEQPPEASEQQQGINFEEGKLG
ncbi:hypothetical protein U9M48_035547 [Paspalum notatum var. saurae]|uniref:Uncharacterized protein n=1 Tax=Paspalum notatum var. saurae TaxID=547442 RepID=A0AAQ3UDC1_PASNO